MFPESDIKLIKGWLKPSDANVAYNYLRYNIKWTDTLKNAEGRSLRIRRKMAYVPLDIYSITNYYGGIPEDRNYVYNGLYLPYSLPDDYLESFCDELLGDFNLEFNSVLLNFYEDGRDEIRWHSDKETQLGDSPVIACVNLGWGRTFWFLNKESGEKVPYWVENGDLLIMGKDCQKSYLHAILKEDRKWPRISLTFREVIGD